MTTTEQTMIAIWQNLFEGQDVSLDSNYFELGGDSVLAMMLTFAISEQMAVDLPPEALFDAPTVRTLAAQVSTLKAAVPA